ncbi:restriction endonuclease subunit S [Methanoplanus limicola]|uniref:Restriction modification system DNA specificity domain protein n=1 Tax=Methanoplanus limicola DSM 2279 TaxID=937775 RepID=H1Z2Z2_9EURY|nr:restriction endonuclease subunit S [Methanoplanus limicola]EHQ34731.1 restriction modification system DNA specificity domain protein [Methanoplanus limicola DSM 2279]
MRTMKDSGIEWIGKIPEDWNVFTLKRVFSERNGGAWGEEAKGNDGDLICIRVADFNFSNLKISIKNEYTKRNYPKNIIDKLLLKPGDILIEKSGGGDLTPVGRVVIFLEDFPAIYANFIEKLKVNREHYPMYVEYLLSTLYNTTISLKYIKQTTGIQNLDISAFLSKENVALPNINEQTRIASFLDKKCAAIDSAIENQRASIDKLKEYRQSVITEAVTKGLNPDVPMKDSGVEWIGEIPEGWDVTKVSMLYNVVLGKMLSNNPSDESDTLENYLCAANLKWDGIRVDEVKRMWFSKTEKSRYLLNKGDIVVTEGGDIGVSSEYLGEASPCYIQNAVHKVTAKDKNASNKLFYYWMGAVKNSGYLDLICNKATIAHYTKEKLCTTPVLAIPIKEQTEITGYLDEKCTAIDEAVSGKEKLIEKLEEYKKSLIYEAVTGKIEIAEIST